MNNEIKDIQKLIIQFRKERDWEQFHTVKDLLIGLNMEVAELQELFLWKSDSEIKEIDKTKIGNEIADIFIFLTYVLDEFKLDLLDEVRKKIQLNESKYPIDKFKGSNKKYNE